MRRVFGFLALAAMVATSLWAVGRIDAQEAVQSVKSARGGHLAKTAQHQFEVFVYPTGVRVFVQDKAGAALNTARLTGTATFYHPNSSKPWFSRPLRAENGYLDVGIGLEKAPSTGGTVTFEISGLADSSESTASFTTPLELVSTPAPPQGGSPSVPRYVYGLGYEGYGYYEHTSSGTNSTSTGNHSYMSSIPGMFGPGGMTVGPGYRDWSTGRESPLAKPWLRPLD